MSNDSSDRVVSRWRTAGETGDADLAIQCLAADVVLISPLTEQFRFTGAGQVGQVLKAALNVVHDVTYYAEVRDGSTCAMFYRGQCGGEHFEEAQLLRLDDAGLIAEITLFGRPLPGLTALMSEIGPPSLRSQGRSRLATAIRVATFPLHAMATAGEKRIMPLADPDR